MELTESKRKYIITCFLNKDIFIPPDFIDYLKDENIVEYIYDLIKKDSNNIDLRLLSLELLNKFTIHEQKKEDETTIKFSYEDKPSNISVNDFVSYFRQRLKSLGSIIRGRPELQNVVSINRIINKRDRENISLIGLVRDKQITKNGNLMITVEDQTGCIKVIVNKSKPELFEIAKDIVLDEVIGITGVNGDRIIFVDNIIFPDVPLTKELKKSPHESYVIFLSDLHVGSQYFLEDKLFKFIKWLSGEVGSEAQKNMAKKVSHIFIIGDLVDGVGIYPGQENELTIKDIYKQYEMCANYISMIPKNIKIIICPGNHDALRISEPQPNLYDYFAEYMYKIPNAVMVSNPSLVNIGKRENFGGFDVLLYHGYSFDYYVRNVETIRNNGGYDRADLIMKFLLQKRHLAPTYSSTLFIPTPDKDNLVISKIPDIFVTGHIHKTYVSSYRNVTLICGSCWQSTTPFQVKVGHHPEPARVPILNLQTREIKILKF